MSGSAETYASPGGSWERGNLNCEMPDRSLAPMRTSRFAALAVLPATSPTGPQCLTKRNMPVACVAMSCAVCSSCSPHALIVATAVHGLPGRQHRETGSVRTGLGSTVLGCRHPFIHDRSFMHYFRHHADRGRSRDSTSKMRARVPSLNLNLLSDYAGFGVTYQISQLSHETSYTQYF